MAGTAASKKLLSMADSAERQALIELNKVVTDLETIRGAAASSVVAVTELVADHATFKTAVDQTETLVEELHDDHATVRTWIVESDADQDVMNNYLDFLHEADGVRFGDYTFATQGAATILMAGVVSWVRSGIRHFKGIAGNLTLAAPSTATIANTKFGAWRVVISDAGAVTTQAANATTMQFANAEDALLNLAAIAPTASTTTLGYMVVENGTGGDFTINTTATNTGSLTWTFYYERAPRKQATGLTAALGAATAVGSTPENYATGTKDVMINGLTISQIAAEADKAFDDADTIGQSQFGGWLIVTNLAQSATYALAANGVAGAVSAMTYADAAAATTALNSVADNLPSMFCPISKLVIQNNLGGAWTAGTDDLNGTDGTATFTDATVGTWSRTATTGFDSHKINPPAVPASITADIVATLAASKPASAPATLSASAPSSTAIDTAGDLTAAQIKDERGTVITA